MYSIFNVYVEHIINMNIDITARNRIKSTGTYIHLLFKELKAASKICGFCGGNSSLRIILNLPSNPLVMLILQPSIPVINADNLRTIFEYHIRFN